MVEWLHWRMKGLHLDTTFYLTRLAVHSSEEKTAELHLDVSLSVVLYLYILFCVIRLFGAVIC